MNNNGALTREQFMFQEMRIIARLRIKGFSDQEILDRVFQENLFQYPTEREIKSKCRACLKRLDSMADIPFAIDALANSTIGEAKQAALIALMCRSLLMRDFLINVIVLKTWTFFYVYPESYIKLPSRKSKKCPCGYR